MAGRIETATAFDRRHNVLREGDAVRVTGGPYAPKSLPHRLLMERGVVAKVYSGGMKVLVEFTGGSSWEKPRRFDPRALERITPELNDASRIETLGFNAYRVLVPGPAGWVPLSGQVHATWAQAEREWLESRATK